MPVNFQIARGPGQATPTQPPTGRVNFPIEGPNLAEQIGGGFLLGLTDEPLVGKIIGGIVEALPGVDQGALGRLRQRLAGSDAASAARLVGEFAPSLAIGAGAFSAGRFAAVRGLQALAKGKTAGRLGQVAAKAQDVAGAFRPIPKPDIQRTVEVAGGALGIGGFSGSEALAEGASPEEALKTAALTTAIAASLEGVIVVGARALTGRAKPRDIAKIEEQFEVGLGGGESPRQIFQKAQKRALSQAQNLTNKIETILGTPRQLAALEALEFGGPMRAARTLTKAERAKVAELTQQVKAAQASARAAGVVLRNPGVVAYTKDGVWNPSQSRQMLSELGLLVTSAPESFEGKLGPSAARIFARLEQAEAQVTLETSAYEKLIEGLAVKAAKAAGLTTRAGRAQLGLTRKGARTTGWLDVAHAYETQGEAGLREFLVTRLGRTPKQADDVVDSFSQLTKMMDHINERLQVVGGKPKANLEELGVQRFLSHLGEDLTDEQIAQRLALRFRPEQVQGIMSAAEQAGFVTARQERALERATARGQGRRHRIGRYGPIDFNRVLRGSLRDKFRQGLPVNTDPFDATLRFLQAGSRRIRMTEAVGARGELVDDAAKAMIAEGRDPALFLNIMDNFLDTKYYNRSLRTMAHSITGFQVASKMSMGVIANLTQPQNTAYMFGLRGAFKGAMLATQRENRTRVAQGLAIHHSMLKNMGRSIDEEGLVKNAAQKLAEFTLKWTGFNTFEKFNRVHAGLTGYAVVRDSLMRASRGRLRGNNLDWHRRMLRDLGIDLDRSVRDIANVGEEAFFGSAKYQLLEDAAIFRAAQKTQFIPSKMRRPQFWNHPIGRVAFQFKTFALGQGRLLRDTVLTEAAHGNLRPLAYFLSISPIAGEFIVDTRGLIKGRDRDTKGLLRALENSTYAGGFGLATDLLGSARFGNLLGALTGPTINDASDVVERMVQGDVTGIGRLISRTPAFQLTTGILTGGALTTQAITEYLDALGDADLGDNVLSLGDLLQSDAEQK